MLMMETDIFRRSLLKMGLALSVSSLLVSCQQSPTKQGLVLSGCDDRSGQHYLAGVSAKGELVFQIPVPQRVHDIVYLKAKNRAVFVARRPGNHLYVVDLNSNLLVETVTGAPGRHFYGHGVVSNDQQWLYVTENDFNHNLGKVGVYRIGDTLKKETEFASHGIGPHQLTLESKGDILVIANGGLQTHPESGRKVLNLDSMAPNLSYLSLSTGALLDQVTPPNHLMSIRHLDIASNDRVVAGIQYQGQLTDLVPSVLVHKRGETARWISFPETLQLSVKQYIASVAVNNDARLAVVSCPRGNRFVVCDLTSHSVAQEIPCRDAAGLRFVTDHWVGSNGEGDVMSMGAGASLLAVKDQHNVPLRWDNHLTVI